MDGTGDNPVTEDVTVWLTIRQQQEVGVVVVLVHPAPAIFGRANEQVVADSGCEPGHQKIAPRASPLARLVQRQLKEIWRLSGP